jgi:hypothetical protein
MNKIQSKDVFKSKGHSVQNLVHMTKVKKRGHDRDNIFQSSMKFSSLIAGTGIETTDFSLRAEKEASSSSSSSGNGCISTPRHRDPARRRDRRICVP